MIVLDFETEAITKGAPVNGMDKTRWSTAPRPVGLAVMFPEGSKASHYYAWGHPTKNNCELGEVQRVLRKIEESDEPLLFQNAKFDLAVLRHYFGIVFPWERVHDTLFTLFLRDPHAKSLSLKPAAEQWLGMKPEERDAVRDWLVEHGVIGRNENPGPFISKAPGDLVGKYAVGDVVRTWKLFRKLQPEVEKLGMREAYDVERQLLPILMDSERLGIRVDVKALSRDMEIYTDALGKADIWIRKRLNAPGLSLDSNADLAVALRTSGVVEKFPKTPTGRDSVSKKVLIEEFFSDRKVWLALYYRNALATVLSMSMRPWLEQAMVSGGYIFTEWNQVRQSHGNDGFRGARSGRITCSYFQNVTKTFMDRGDGYEHPAFLEVPELPLVRKYVLPDEGSVWGHNDYNQQEMRLVAHYEEGRLAEMYRTNPGTDIHQDVRDLIEKVTGKPYERRPVKIVNFRTVYGGGKSGLAAHLNVPYREASDLIDNWKRALPDVVALDRDLKDRFYQGKHLRTYGGRVYHCKPPSIATKGPRKGQLISYEYTALNYLIQPSGADVTKRAIINYHQACQRGRMLSSVHDEINLSVPKGPEGVKEMKILRDCMESIKLDVPWKTETKMGKNWGSLKKKEIK